MMELSELTETGGQVIQDLLLCTRLENGVKIPRLAMWNANSKSVSRDIDKCLLSGYRHIVLSSGSERDQEVGETLQRWIQKSKPGHSRDELFISLLYDLGPVIGVGNVQQQLNNRIQALDCQHIDMLVLYKGDNMKIGDNLRQRNAVASLWKAFEKLVNKGMIRCLSLANFCQNEVESLTTSCSIQPSALWLSSDASRLGWRDMDHVHHYCLYKGLTMGVMHRVDRPEAEWVRNHGSALGIISRKIERTPLQVFHRMLIQQNFLVALSSDMKTMEKGFQIFDFSLKKDDITELKNTKL